MTEQEAQKLASLVIDTYGKEAARLVSLSDGREFAVFIKQPGYFLWDWPDWTQYRHQDKQAQKRKRARPREEVQHAIDYSEAFALAM